MPGIYLLISVTWPDVFTSEIMFWMSTWDTWDIQNIISGGIFYNTFNKVTFISLQYIKIMSRILSKVSREGGSEKFFIGYLWNQNASQSVGGEYLKWVSFVKTWRSFQGRQYEVILVWHLSWLRFALLGVNNFLC